MSDRVKELLDHARQTPQGIIAERSDLHVDRVWALYISLPDARRNHIDLKHELIQWFGSQSTKAADAHTLDLYFSSPIQERSDASFNIVLGILIKDGQWNSLCHLHHDILWNTATPSAYSGPLFRQVVDFCHWPTAMKLWGQVAARYPRVDTPERKGFWKGMHGILSVNQKAKSLVDYLRLKKETEGGHLDNLGMDFLAHFIRETIVIAGTAAKRDGQKLQSAQADVTRLFKHIRKQLPAEIMATIESTLLRLHELDLQLRSAEIQRVIEHFYMFYRSLQGFAPSIELLTMMLHRLLIFSDNGEQQESSHNSISIEGLIRDWQKQHFHVTRSGVQPLVFLRTIGTAAVVQPVVEISERAVSALRRSEAVVLDVASHSCSTCRSCSTSEMLRSNHEGTGRAQRPA